MNNMKICNNGHYYDGNRYTECPYCKGAGSQASSAMGKTMPLGAEAAAPVPNAAPIPNAAPMAPAAPVVNMEKTMRVVEEKNGDPVVGWLVCTDGPAKGQDYRLHADNNYVGRSTQMDVAITKDDSVSSSNHFCVTYDRRHQRFYVAMGMGKEIVYVNDQPLTSAALTLKKFDKIEVGRTTLVFVPLCGDDFQWNWEV